MKRINTLLSAALLLGSTASVFTSCEKNNTEQLNPEGETITLTASTESAPNTKTYLGGDNMTQVYWNPILDDGNDDMIVIYDAGNSCDSYTIASIDPEDPTKATFTGTALTGDAAYAIYPRGADMGPNAIMISESLSYQPNNVFQKEMPMYAKLTDYTSPMAFKNLCGILKLQLMKAEGETDDVNVTKIELTSPDDIAGNATITYNDGNPTLAFTDMKNKTITLDCSSYNLNDEEKTSVSLADYSADGAGATIFYIVVPPTTSNTFTIKVTTADGKMMTKVTPADAANKIERNKITTMPALAFVAGPVRYVDEWGIDRGAGIKIGEVVWAPVNCGYLAASEDSDTDNGKPGVGKGYPWGKLYQWGRKDGQGYKKDSYEDATYPAGTTIVGALTADGASTNPADNTFYEAAFDANSSWLMKSASESAFDESTEWNALTGFGPKVVNPCPEGWRVPTNTELENLIGNKSSWISSVATGPNNETQTGYYFSGSTNIDSAGDNKIFLPAAGCRFVDGNASYRGISGRYWSSTPNDTGAYYLYFHSGLADVPIFNRAEGYSVRCVQD